MSDFRQRRVLVIVAAAAGLVVLAAASVLTVDAVGAGLGAPAEKARMDDLIQQARTSAAAAEELHAYCDVLTEASLRREQWRAVLAPILAVAAVVFLISVKWLMGLRRGEARRPALPRRLAALRVEPTAAPATASVESAAVAGDQPPEAGAAETIDLSFVDEIVTRVGRGKAAVIPILQEIQSHHRYLPEAALRRVCELTEIGPAQFAGVASFYTQFRRRPVGKHIIKVCHGTACHVAGAERITDALRRHLGIGPGQDTDAAREFTLEQVACMGCCTLAPVAQIDDETHGHLRTDTGVEVLSRCMEEKTNGKMRAAWRLPPDQGRGLLGRGLLVRGLLGQGRFTTGGGDTIAGEIRIGLGSCCIANGSGQVRDALADALAAARVRVNVKRVGCVGMCHQTPLIEINQPGRAPARYACAKPEHAEAIVRRHFRPRGLARRMGATVTNLIDHLRDGPGRRVTQDHAIELRDPPVAAFLGRQKHIATEHCGSIDPTDLDEYLRHEGFKALQRCIRELNPAKVIEQVRRSGLRGRGGAGFPTAEKWRMVREAGQVKSAADGAGKTPGKKTGLRQAGSLGRVLVRKYVICNGDEGDPGAFMDRMLMESYPYRIIEGLAIAAYAVGASEGVFYIRREYALAAERIAAALRECERRGLLGGDAAGGGLRLRVVEGAGAFVCGEETALIASLEGRRGMPRLRPPYPAASGLEGRPTLVNNVETLAVVPWILRHGPQAFAELGTETSKGTKVFALAGKVRRGGLIEVPMGVTIREIVEDIGGGIKTDSPAGRRCHKSKTDSPAGRRCHTFKAVQIGGPSGGCVPAALADTPVDYEALAGVGAIMGSGGLVVLDDQDCMVDIARYFLEFTQGQSCGKCTHCRIGTRRMLEIIERLCGGEGRSDDLERLEHLARMVQQGSLCGLGKTAPNPVLTMLRYFRDEYEVHLEGRCPAGRCKALIRYVVTDRCSGCTLCAQHCPVDAIAMAPYERHEIDTEKCTRCDTCKVRCPEEAIEIVSGDVVS